jgi:hypothetical protein
MSEAWASYFARVNGALSSIAVDLSLHEHAPDPSRPQLLWVWIRLQRPRADGLASPEEAERLRAAEEALTTMVAGEFRGVLAGRITGAGRREFYCYAPRADGWAPAAKRALAALPEYAVDYAGAQPDPEWSQYRDLLYPTPRQRRQAENQATIFALAEAGDELGAVRPVDHWVYFRSSDARRSFQARAAALGFQLVDDLGVDPERPAHPHRLHLRRAQAVDVPTVEAVTDELFAALEGLDGEYDGWAAPVVRQQP